MIRELGSQMLLLWLFEPFVISDLSRFAKSFFFRIGHLTVANETAEYHLKGAPIFMGSRREINILRQESHDYALILPPPIRSPTGNIYRIFFQTWWVPPNYGQVKLPRMTGKF